MIFILNKNNTIDAFLMFNKKGQITTEYFNGFDKNKLKDFHEFVSKGRANIKTTIFPSKNIIAYGHEDILADDPRYQWSLARVLQSQGFEAGVALEQSHDILLKLDNPKITHVDRAEIIAEIANMSSEHLDELKKELLAISEI